MNYDTASELLYLNFSQIVNGPHRLPSKHERSRKLTSNLWRMKDRKNPDGTLTKNIYGQPKFARAGFIVEGSGKPEFGMSLDFDGTSEIGTRAEYFALSDDPTQGINLRSIGFLAFTLFLTSRGMINAPHSVFIDAMNAKGAGGRDIVNEFLAINGRSIAGLREVNNHASSALGSLLDRMRAQGYSV